MASEPTPDERADLAHRLSKIVHDRCAGRLQVPHDIGLHLEPVAREAIDAELARRANPTRIATAEAYNKAERDAANAANAAHILMIQLTEMRARGHEVAVWREAARHAHSVLDEMHQKIRQAQGKRRQEHRP